MENSDAPHPPHYHHPNREGFKKNFRTLRLPPFGKFSTQIITFLAF